ncbi:hypothetical protein [Pedobacter sp. UBA5917]|jgi:phosphatidylinositol glycan class B|uniref:hypothetical protein n=1 Tax=Pedobacter sp. UBA5917 TaxID=1947061 RepID=UPI0025EDE989|nr:hypothetical protein [Pedobacter sp. UBA5917]
MKFQKIIFPNLKAQLNPDFSENHFFFAFVVLFYFAVAYFSSGYHHPDEHFQIIEFANYKLGRNSQADLAWEYQARIRPVLQPVFCLIIFKICSLSGIEDPYILAFVLRLISVVISVYIIRYFINSVNNTIDRSYRNIFVVLSYFLWFIPYINARFSSESWSGIFFLLGLAITLRKKHGEWGFQDVALGAVLGISILFRFQAAIMVFGLLSWMLVVGERPVKRLVACVLAMFMILFFGILLDSWFYGDLQVTAYNYAYINLVKDVASQFGTSPWYEILYYIFYSTGPMGCLIIISYILILIYQPKHFLIWITFPFLLVHTIIAHKELRFLFPLANLVPIFLITGVQLLHNSFFPWKRFLTMFAIAFSIINVIALYGACFRGAGNAQVSVGEFIHKRYPGKQVNIICVNGANPFVDWASPKDTFYSHPNISRTDIITIWGRKPLNRLKGFTNLLIIKGEDITGPKTEELLRKKRLKLVYRNFDTIQGLIGDFYSKGFKQDITFIYEL